MALYSDVWRSSFWVLKFRRCNYPFLKFSFRRDNVTLFYDFCSKVKKMQFDLFSKILLPHIPSITLSRIFFINNLKSNIKICTDNVTCFQGFNGPPRGRGNGDFHRKRQWNDRWRSATYPPFFSLPNLHFSLATCRFVISCSIFSL